MKMFKFFSDDHIALEIVQKAFYRSFSKIRSKDQMVSVFISPKDDMFDQLSALLRDGQKIVVLGKIGLKTAQLLRLELNDSHNFEDKKASLPTDHKKECHTTEYRLIYTSHLLNQNTPYWKRYFARFDFTDEWNNQGYGRITIDDSIWAVSSMVKNIFATSVATIEDDSGYVGEFATVSDFDHAAVLYINRPVGTVDGLDWGIVENFLCRYRIDDLVAVPLIHDLPQGVKGIVSARLDCDQSIINAKPLVDLYKSYGINISLGISTGIPINQYDIDFMIDFYQNGGSLVSHTITHHYSWGRDYVHALEETSGSKQWLEENIPGLKVDYAISPFHSNEPFAVQALADAGYKGFVSGIIHNDPEYLVGVSGEVPFVTFPIVTHSQQCMIHGDCFHRYGKSIHPHVEAFEMYLKAGKLFGYLDHPFGGYDYGWLSEEERLSAHRSMIEAINQHQEVQWWTLTQLLDFVVRKSKTILSIEDNILKIISKEPDVVIEYRGQLYV